MRPHRLILPLIALLAAPLAAQEAITSAAPDKVGVTIYRAPDRDSDEAMALDWLEGYELVTEQRTVTVPAGRSTVRFEGVASGILPESALVTGLPGGVREKNLDADLLSPASLYARSLGRPVILRRTNDATGKVEEQRAVIRSGPEGSVIVQTRDGFEAANCGPQTDDLVYTEMPPGLSARPTLSVELDSPVAQRLTLSLSYLAWGFDWQTNYVWSLREGGREADVTAWVTLASSDATSFADADAAVVGGEVNREDERRYQDRPDSELVFRCYFSGIVAQDIGSLPSAPPPMAAMSDELAEIVVTGNRVSAALQRVSGVSVTAVQEELGDLKLYRVPIPTTVAAQAQKQVALFDRKRARVKVLYVTDIYQESANDLSVMLRAKNRKEDGLGIALPGGPVAVFEPHGEDMLLVGEGGLGDKAVGEEVEVRLAAATQVTIEGESVAEGKDWQEYKVVVRNANPWPVAFEGRLTFDPGSFRLDRPSRKLGRKDGYPLWAQEVPANGEITLRYRLLEQPGG